MSGGAGSAPGLSAAERERAALVAASLDATPELLPVVAAMLADFDALGGCVDDALAMLDSAGVAPPGLALDLGCGKGAYAVALARRGWDVHAVDLFEPFLAEARRRIVEAGVSDRCRVEAADLRDALTATPAGSTDLVLLMGVGRPLGGLSETVRGATRVLRSGGHFLLDDAFLAPGAAPPPGLEGYESLEATERATTCSGGAIVARWAPSPEERRERHRRELSLIRARAERIIRDDPRAAPLARAYLRRQEAAYAELDGPVQPAAWLVRSK